jgi:hypothetical protein
MESRTLSKNGRDLSMFIGSRKGASREVEEAVEAAVMLEGLLEHESEGDIDTVERRGRP